MVINFGEDNCSSLIVKPFDNPFLLAKQFCFKHNIESHVIEKLAENIRNFQANSFHHQNETSFKI